MVAAVVAGAGVAFSLWAVGVRLQPGPHGRRIADLGPMARRFSLCLVVMMSALGSAAAVALLPERPATVGFVVVAASAPGLGFIDLVTERLPFELTGLVGGLAGLAFTIDAITSGDVASAVRAAVAAAVLSALASAAAFLPGPGGESVVGAGDIVFAAVVAGTLGWLGWPEVWIGFAFAFLLRAITISVARVRPCAARIMPGGYMPLGPFLLAGWWAAVALASTNWI
ncbi:hypothetical protein GCM10029992_36480 [Glycomyces albus]